MLCVYRYLLHVENFDYLRDGIKSYGKFAIFTRLRIDLEIPPPLPPPIFGQIFLKTRT